MLPWAEMMRASLTAGVPVSGFWTLSVREWRWLSQGESRPGLGAGELADLMKYFPDKEE